MIKKKLFFDIFNQPKTASRAIHRISWDLDRFKTDIFEIQDEIVRKIVLAILGEIEISHRRKPTANMTSYECLKF